MSERISLICLTTIHDYMSRDEARPIRIFDAGIEQTYTQAGSQGTIIEHSIRD